MNKQDITRLGVKIASKELGIEEADIELVFKPKEFFQHEDINAMFIPEVYRIVFDETWIEQAQELEILKCAFHETRHAYQRACIDFPKQIGFNEESKVIEVWKKEHLGYRNPLEEGYLDQEIEKDAIRFSEMMIEKIVSEFEQESKN